MSRRVAPPREGVARSEGSGPLRALARHDGAARCHPMGSEDKQRTNPRGRRAECRRFFRKSGARCPEHCRPTEPRRSARVSWSGDNAAEQGRIDYFLFVGCGPLHRGGLPRRWQCSVSPSGRSFVWLESCWPLGRCELTVSSGTSEHSSLHTGSRKLQAWLG